MKSKRTEYIKRADSHIKGSGLLKDNKLIKGCNGQIAAFGVSIALLGLLPTLVIYSNNSETTICKKEILNVISQMLGHESKELLTKVVEADSSTLSGLKKQIMESITALKLVARTYQEEIK